MNSNELHNRFIDSARKVSPIEQRSGMYDAFKEYQISHCYHPRRLKVFCGTTGMLEDIEVPCGRCPHCLQTKKNEWTTRAYAHAEFFRNVYFVTLTYRSFTSDLLDKYPPYRYLIRYLEGAVWHEDTFNSLHKLCYSPSVLCKSHYQLFLKRLRKNTGLSDITYMLCGEYGHDYGRPHFHLVLFTNGVLKASDIHRAWSVCLVSDGVSCSPARNNSKNKRWYSIGRISFDDLVRNGSFDEQKQIVVDGQNMSAANCFAYVAKYLHKDEYNNRRVRIAYDLPSDSSSIFLDNKQTKIEFNYVHKTPSVPCLSWNEFRFFFRPFFRVSLGTPIGSNYVSSHIQEMAKGKFSQPALQAKGFVVPSYFRRKVSEYLFPYRKISSRSLSLSLVKDNVPLSCLGLRDALSRGDFVTFGRDFSEIGDLNFILRHSSLTFVDTSTRERCLILFDCFGSVWVNRYKYNRSTRSFDFVREQDIRSFIEHYCTSAKSEYDEYVKKLRERVKSQQLYEHSLLIADSCLDFKDLRDAVLSDLEHESSYIQKNYNLIHKHLE